jgi:hypothetical protein
MNNKRKKVIMQELKEQRGGANVDHSVLIKGVHELSLDEAGQPTVN